MFLLSLFSSLQLCSRSRSCVNVLPYPHSRIHIQFFFLSFSARLCSHQHATNPSTNQPSTLQFDPTKMTISVLNGYTDEQSNLSHPTVQAFLQHLFSVRCSLRLRRTIAFTRHGDLALSYGLDYHRHQGCSRRLRKKLLAPHIHLFNYEIECKT